MEDEPAALELFDTVYVSLHMVSVGLMAYCAALFVYRKARSVYCGRRPRRRAGASRPHAGLVEPETSQPETAPQPRRRRRAQSVAVTEPVTEELVATGADAAPLPPSAPSVDELICVVCMDGRRDAVLPCRHLATCTTCTTLLLRLHAPCPLCRQPFTRFTRIFTC